MVIDVAQQQAVLAPVDDEAQVAADAHRPEVFVLRLVEPVELHAGVGRVELEVEGGGLDGLLLVSGQARKTARECVCNEKVHRVRP